MARLEIPKDPVAEIKKTSMDDKITLDIIYIFIRKLYIVLSGFLIFMMISMLRHVMKFQVKNTQNESISPKSLQN